MKKLILIDGNAIVHRAFHSTPPFQTANGELVNAVYGFSSMLLTILNTQRPDYIAVSFDLKGKTFRHEEYKEYKATRAKAPDGLYEQIPLIKEVVRTFQIPIYEIEGFEADDVLGTLSLQADKLGNIQTYIVTGDRDTLQLISERTRVIMPVKGFSQVDIYDIAKVMEKYGITPQQVPEMKGLEGDSSDNIKGVGGIGAKTALTLVQKYGKLENIYENIEEIKGKVKENLVRDKENAFFSRRLATIITDVDMKLKLEDCVMHEYDRQAVIDMFASLNFKSLLARLGQVNNQAIEKQNMERNIQPSLF